MTWEDEVTEVARACFRCKESDEDVFLKPDNPGLQHLHTEFSEFEQTDDPCEICGADESLRKV